jgi:hypothetical protein
MSAAAAASSTHHAPAESLDIEQIVSALQQVRSVSLIDDRECNNALQEGRECALDIAAAMRASAAETLFISADVNPAGLDFEAVFHRLCHID